MDILRMQREPTNPYVPLGRYLCGGTLSHQGQKTLYIDMRAHPMVLEYKIIIIIINSQFF